VQQGLETGLQGIVDNRAEELLGRLFVQIHSRLFQNGLGFLNASSFRDRCEFNLSGHLDRMHIPPNVDGITVRAKNIAVSVRRLIQE
jgi:hypothetical protein